ncbi:MAG: helix-turn-helix domain-containing protein [Chloroflexota bacterium]
MYVEGDFNVAVGFQMRMARIKLGLTQAELSKRVNKSVQTISSYENGERMCTVAELPIMAEALEVGVTYFFDFEDIGTSPDTPIGDVIEMLSKNEYVDLGLLRQFLNTSEEITTIFTEMNDVIQELGSIKKLSLYHSLFVSLNLTMAQRFSKTIVDSIFEQITSEGDANEKAD